MGFVFKAAKGVVKAVIGVVKGVVKVLGKVVGGILSFIRPKGNAKNKATDGRLSKSLAPEDNRKIIFGKTCFGCDLRFWEVFGAPQWADYAEVIAAATHKVTSFGNFYAEDQLIGFNGSGVSTNPKFVGLTRKLNDGTVGNAALAVGSGTYWDANSKFTGVAHYALSWKTDEKSLPGGVPSRYTQEGEGAPVYDPRKDSTRGGSGSHRVDDQSTWAYLTLDSNSQPIGRNNALQMLWYLIGWRINGKLVAGRGLDPNDINWPEMIAAANDAEARGYYTDMCLSTGDSHETNEAIISADGLLGEVIDPGGLWTYKITKDDTADIAVTLTDDDVIDAGEVEWVPQPGMSEQFNEVAGTFIDPSATSLYQPKAYPTVTDATYVTADGFRRRVTHDFQCVQDVSLAQKLARIKLNRSRFPGEFKATFNMRALKAQAWSNVRLSLERYGFVSKLFRVYSQTITEHGIEMVLREEDPSVYANGTVTVPASPGAIARFDPFQTYAVAGLTASAITQSQASNNRVGVRLSWTALPNNVRRIELQYKRTADSVWTPGGFLSYDATTADLLGLLGSTGYTFQLRTWSNLEQPSAWATITQTTSALSTDWASLSGSVPSAVNNGSISIQSNGTLVGAGGGQVTYTGIGGGAYGDANRVRFSMFEQNMVGWAVYNPSALAVTVGAYHDGGLYAEPSDYIGLSTTFTASGQSIRILSDAVLSGNRAFRIPVTPGERIFVGAYVAFSGPAGSSWLLRAGFKNEANADVTGGFTAASGTTNPAGFVGGFTTVPAGAVYLSFEFGADSGGTSGALNLFLFQPMVCSAGPGQTTFPAFSPGPTGESGAQVTRWIELPPQRLSFRYNSAGTTADTGEFSRDISFKLMTSNGIITADSWRYQVISGTVNGYTSASGGGLAMSSGSVGILTVNSLGSSEAKVQVTATYLGQPYTYTVTLIKETALPTTGGGAAVQIASDTTFGQFNTGVFVDISGPITGTIPAGKSSATIDTLIDCMPASGSTVTTGIEMKVMRDIGGTPTQIGATQSGTSYWYAFDNNGDFASFAFTISDTGLTASTTYTWRIYARITNGSRNHTPTGNVSVSS